MYSRPGRKHNFLPYIEDVDSVFNCKGIKTLKILFTLTFGNVLDKPPFYVLNSNHSR